MHAFVNFNTLQKSIVDSKSQTYQKSVFPLKPIKIIIFAGPCICQIFYIQDILFRLSMFFIIIISISQLCVHFHHIDELLYKWIPSIMLIDKNSIPAWVPTEYINCLWTVYFINSKVRSKLNGDWMNECTQCHNTRWNAEKKAKD